MSKDSYWFKHDCSAGRGTKIRKIQFIYGHEGKGLYWDVIEVLREQNGYKHESDEMSLRMLCDLIGFKDFKRFNNWFNDCVKYGLLINEKGYFYSQVLSENMKSWESKKSNGSKGGRPKSKPNQNRIKTETKTESKANQNHKRREEKKREEKEYTLIVPFFYDLDFQESWSDWQKVRKSKKASTTDRAISMALKKLSKLSGNDKVKAIAIMDQSSTGGWSDLYELKQNHQQDRISNQFDQIKSGNYGRPVN